MKATIVDNRVTIQVDALEDEEEKRNGKAQARCRDVNALKSLGLFRVSRSGARALTENILTFLSSKKRN